MSNFINSWSTLIKRYVATNVIYSGRATKLAGINDFASLFTGAITFTAPDQITFAGSPPSFLTNLPPTGKLFRVTSGGGGNNAKLLRAISILGNTVTVTGGPVVAFAGPTTLDGRIWRVIDDTSIAKSTSTGSTMYNVHNRIPTTIGGDASEVALIFAEHYHDEPADLSDDPVDEILFHKYNEIGEKSMVMGDCTMKKIDIGPLAVVDNCGDVIRIESGRTNPVNDCYPELLPCPGQTCDPCF